MNEELKQKLTERFEAISAKAECDNEVRDALLKAYLAGGEHGYQYAIEKGWKLIEKLCDSHNIVSIKDGKYKSRSWLEEQFRKAMQ